MWKISNRIKVVLVKGYILFVFCWMLLFFFVGIRYEAGINPEWRLLYLLVYVIFVLLVIIMVYLMSKVDIAPAHAEPIIKLVSAKGYESFKQMLFKRAENCGFGDIHSGYIGEDIEMTLGFKYTKGATYVLQMVWMQDFETEWVDKATELFWKETANRVGEEKIEYEAVGLIQCICVKRMNKEFKKFTVQNVQQEYKRYQILTAISFGGKKAYICQTKGGFFRSYFRYLSKMFEELTDGILLTRNDTEQN